MQIVWMDCGAGKYGLFMLVRKFGYVDGEMPGIHRRLVSTLGGFEWL